MLAEDTLASLGMTMPDASVYLQDTLLPLVVGMTYIEVGMCIEAFVVYSMPLHCHLQCFSQTATPIVIPKAVRLE